MTEMLATVLARLATELRVSAQISAQLEAVVQEAFSSLPHAPVPPRDRWRDIQNLDLLTQRLADLGHFLDRLAVSVPEHAIDIEQALAGLNLRALRDDLAGGACNLRPEAGHVDVF